MKPGSQSGTYPYTYTYSYYHVLIGTIKTLALSFQYLFTSFQAADVFCPICFYVILAGILESTPACNCAKDLEMNVMSV